MSLLGFCQWLAETHWSVALHESLWVYPLVESTHVWALALFFGFAMILDLRLLGALLHGPAQIADLPLPVAESPGAVRIGHPERGHLVEYLAPNSVFNSLPRQRSSPHLRPDDRLVTIDRVLYHASLRAA